MRRRFACGRLCLAFVAVTVAAVPMAQAAASPAGGLTGQLAVAVYNGGKYDAAADVVVSPDGARVYVTGYSSSDLPGRSYPNIDYATVAYDVATGAQLWVARYDGKGTCCIDNGAFDQAVAMALSPDGTRLYVTGISEGSDVTGVDFATVAYDVVTGAQVWVARSTGPVNGGRRDDEPTAIAVSPDGSRIYVTGWTVNESGFDFHFTTVAYEAVSGVAVWTRHYNGPTANDDTRARDIAISPDGSLVYVTGESKTTNSDYDYETIAYSASSGIRVWAAQYDDPAHSQNFAKALAVSPDASRLYVTGSVYGGQATVAYAARTGRRLWVGEFGGDARAIAVSSDGSRVYAAGEFFDSGDMGVVSYDASTGAQAWTARYNGSADLSDHADDIALDPKGVLVFVTGEINQDPQNATTGDYGTLADKASTGAQLAAATFGGGGPDYATALAVSPDGKRLYVTGQRSTDSGTDYATVVYGIA